ncbi:phospholipid-metabolizing enzyme A-C1-like [Mizuhopecten yessoensis]|uniref:Phospholipid-metabolizing enzyme A-C1 n=1 Tax=Mizuhopecten yessoensis TaxID=6573 RepID=A0A210QMP9_MIZYE|nr:phospholipid-metabolizing enzyme A-C1-like [Mizuhopecten yessoensis]OWF49981.1 Phospholipid-metabolizing enzyme A-C1 [Mizuhopecten yessoensis]
MAASSMSVHSHNATVLNDLKIGDMVEFPRGWYSHWGVYLGEGRIVHLSGGDNDGINGNINSGSVFTICGKNFSKAFVTIDDFWDVVLDCKAIKNNGKDRKCSPRQAHEMVQVAMEKVGEIGYNVLWNNCEHFAAFIRYGKKWSEQADTFLAGTVAVGAIAVGVLLLKSLFKGPEDNKEAKK